MKSQGADVETRANLPVYTISSYTEALAPAPQKHPPHTSPNMFAEVFMLNKVIVSSGPTLPFVLLLLLKPFFKLCHPQLRRSLKNGRREPCKVDIFSSLP
ncbi:hypothetical protein PBY51_007445 [Eleginops maclovinus]|uniref:Uncharacterized protein n=1 Tax=Eleginops maclovinus TaxID=56733 RepID=A0AAN8AHX0_ELEMC|nr:hypothetical protein PBY51_007445 [Eleginops maclovinus]